MIAGVATTSGFYMAENLITAIYHRFVIFEPLFKEGGAGAAVNNSGYAYFTTVRSEAAPCWRTVNALTLSVASKFAWTLMG